MIRLLASLVLHLLANTLGLIAASIFLDGFSIQASGFIMAVLIFTISEVVAGPLIAKVALKSMPALLGGIALVTTLVGLIITDVVSDGLSISGLSTWVLATLIVWLCALIAGVLLPLVIFRNVLKKNQPENN